MVNKNESVMNLIPIFQGKKGSYNRLVLEVLAEAKEPLKPWELAKRIYEKEPKEVDWYRGTQKIYSVLIRKGGRLEELERKKYISLKDGKWSLTIKGIMVALIIRPDLKQKMRNEAIKFLESSIPFDSATLESPEIPVLKIAYNIAEASLKTMKKNMDILPQYLDSFVDKAVESTKALIKRGYDIDRVSEADLLTILTPNIALSLDEIVPKSIIDKMMADLETMFYKLIRKRLKEDTKKERKSSL